ncbi:MAG TPA: TonB-dependent receptor plug domain-containing protein [Opitutaceae bacterium]|nr:TonB-dependent receptor plug domain-containing protein [Opitutaceae bacterium]
MNTKTKLVLGLLITSASWRGLCAQTAPAPSNPAPTDTRNSTVVTTTTVTGPAAASDDQAFQLSPFEVTADKDNGYAATETLAGTRIRTNLADVASAIQVITPVFLQDIGAHNNGELLQYTTNAEVAGTLGTYLGQGNGTNVNETANLRDPETTQRIRGLAAADLARDYFISDIPWDSYNIDRVDIQRGPNAILFGLGSPAGIINASIHSAEFSDFGSVDASTGSYGSLRSSADINQVLIPGMLAIRLDGLWDNTKYEQKQAWQNDRRYSGELRFDPKLFKDPSFHTSIRLKFENGDIKADRPRSLPPYDSITPWFAPVNTSSQNGGLGKLAVPNGYVLGSSASSFFPWLGGYGNQQQPIWFIDGASGQNQRIYGGYVNTGALTSAGVAQGSGVSLIGQKYADVFSDLTNFSSYAVNAHLPNAQYGQYRNRSLLDSSVYNFYDTLIDGPTASQFEKWTTYNIDLQQSFWDDRVGIDATYDRQKYKNGGDSLVNNPTLNVDILQNFQDYVVGPNNTSNGSVSNPNFGRAFVPGGPGSGSSYESDRQSERGSIFGELRASDFFGPNSLMTKIFGKSRFNGVYSDEKYYVENLGWQDVANSEAYAAYKLQGNPDGFQNLPPEAVIYLGPSLANASSASNANIPGITSNVQLQNGNIYQFASTWAGAAGVLPSAPWAVPANLQPFFNGAPAINPATGAAYPALTQASNPANYVGWNSNFTDNLLRYNNGADNSLLTSAAKTLRETKSTSGSWQGYFLDDAIVSTLGWRFDEVETKGATALPLAGATARGALNISPNVYTLPDSFPANAIFKDHSTSGGLVVHLNKLLEKHDFLPFDISLTYDKSGNFQVLNVRRDIYGNPIDNPKGNTKEYGVLLATKDNRFSLRITKYDTVEAGTTVPGFDNSGIYGTIRDALNWRNIKLYDMSAYAWSTAGQAPQANYTGSRYGWDPVYVDSNGRDVASGQATGSAIPPGAVLETSSQALAHEDASIQAINDMQNWLAAKGYFNAWNYGVGPATSADLETKSQYLANPTNPNPASVYDYRTAPLLQGFAVTDDTESKGYEFEFTANPTRNWRIGFNAAKTNATISNVGGAALDGLVNYMDTVMAGPAGDLIRFNSDYSAANELRADWSAWRGQYTLLKLEQGTSAPELRQWSYNMITNYSFDHGALKGLGIGGGYRWQDKVVIGYPVIANPTNANLASFDLSKPYYGPSEDAIDLWASYEHKVSKKVNWKIQINVYNVGKKDGLIPISVEPDGHTWAAARIAPVQEWQLTNSFMF